MWVMVLAPGKPIYAHRHPEAVLSGVYYVNTPAWVHGDAGALRFRDPRAQTDDALEGWNWFGLGADAKVAPTAGDMVIWPGFLEHFVAASPAAEHDAAVVGVPDGQPSAADQGVLSSYRISVSFNLVVDHDHDHEHDHDNDHDNDNDNDNDNDHDNEEEAERPQQQWGLRRAAP